jgi:hypothetical protein
VRDQVSHPYKTTGKIFPALTNTSDLTSAIEWAKQDSRSITYLVRTRDAKIVWEQTITDYLRALHHLTACCITSSVDVIAK